MVARQALRIAHLLPAFGFGGAEIAVAEQVRRAVARGEEPRVFVPAGGAAEEGLAPLVGEALVGLASGTPREGRATALRFALSARRACRAFDVVHAHLPSPDRIGMVLAGTRAPLVLTFEALPEPLARTRRDVLFGRFTPHHWLLRASARRRPLALVGLTRHARAVLGRVYAGVRVETIPNTPPQRDAPPPALRFGVGTRLLAVGRLSREKGAPRLIRALGHASLRDRAWSLCVVGDGPDRPEMEAAAGALGIADRVHFVGSVPITIAPDQADLFVSTSYTEGMPLALLEAMRARMAVAVSSIPAHAEMLGGIEGALLDASEERWPAELARLLDSADLRAAIAAEAHRRQAEHYTDEVQDEAYARLYRSLAEGRCASPG
jgi:glycosyltransferase involved in cell wall biosynthesis